MDWWITEFQDEEDYQKFLDEYYMTNNYRKMHGMPKARETAIMVFLRDRMHMRGPRAGKYFAKAKRNTIRNKKILIRMLRRRAWTTRKSRNGRRSRTESPAKV